MALHHGAYSDRRVAPLAAQIAQEARTAPGWPDYLNTPLYAPAVAAWARAEAVCRLLADYMTRLGGIEAALTETDESETTMTNTKRGQRSVSKSSRVLAVLDLSRRYEAHAARARADLGMTPPSRARLGKDVAATKVDLARYWAEQEDKGVSGSSVT